MSSGDCLGTNWEKKCSGNQIGQKLFYDDKIRQNNAMAIKLGRIALATKLGQNNAMAAKLGRHLFNARTACPLVKSAQVFRLGKKAAKERPATRQLVFWQEFLQVLGKNCWKTQKELLEGLKRFVERPKQILSRPKRIFGSLLKKT